MTDYNKGSIQNFNTRGQVGERESGIPVVLWRKGLGHLLV